MAVGRISGPLLKSNLLRNGIDLAFETDLLYLDVINQRIGVKTDSPTHDLQVNGTTRTNNLTVDTLANIADIEISGNTISSANTLNLQTTGTDTVVYQKQLDIQDISIVDNVINTNNSDKNLELRPDGSGRVEIYSDLQINGNFHATGNISADGDIQIGDADTDSITFNADITSDIVPDQTATYDLGTETKRWDNVWTNNFVAQDIDTGNLVVDGVDLGLRQGNIIYVASNGEDANTGTHPNDPVASIEQALFLSAAGDTVHVYPGEYQENFPLTVPTDVNIKGEGLRSVKIVPTVSTNDQDAFLLNGETTVEDLTVADFYYNSSTNTGHAFRFANGMIVTSRSPYVKNVSVITKGSVTTTEDPRGFNQGDAGRGVYLDGAVVDAASREAGCLFHSVTFITPGVDAVTLTNGVRVEWLNCFTYFADKSVYAFNGTQGLYGDGKTYIRLSGVSGGSFQAGDTVTFTSTDSSTVVTANVESVDGDVLIVDGDFADLQDFDTTPESIGNGSGVTAESIESVIRTDFGAEVRMIGSASVYGNFGLYGDGAGVIVYAIGHNLAYIGNGKEVTNDPETVIQDNEVVEVNDAKIRYNSVDHKGDFRVGDLFYVNQQDGTVDFAVSDFTIDTTGGVTFTTAGDSTFVDGTKIETGNWRISGNTVETLLGDANIDAVSGNINLNDNVNITGDLDVTGNVTIGGNITIGDEVTDTIQFIAGIDSDIVPKIDSVYSLGTSDKTWSNLWVNQVNVGDIEIRDNYIQTTVSNADLELRANGTGTVYIPENDLQINNNLTVNGTATLADTDITGTVTLDGDFSQTGDQNVLGSVVVGENLTVGASAQFEEILIDDNYITTTTTNANLELRANGTGAVLIPNNDVAIANDLAVTGDISSSNITVSNNVTSDSAIIGNIEIANNLIESTATNTDLELRANGTGAISVPTNDVELGQALTVSGSTDLQNTTITGTVTQTGNTIHTGNYTITGSWTNGDLEFDNNVITTTQINSNLELRANGTGEILVPNNDVIISKDLTVSGSTDLQDTEINGTLTHTGDTVQTGNYTVTGDVSISGTFDVDSTAQFENIRISGNTVSTTDTNSDLELRANGTGDVVVPENDVQISNDLYVDGTITVGDVNSAGTITANRFSTGDILIDDNFITTTTSNSDLELRANGTGEISVPANDVAFEQDLSVNGVTELNNTVVVGSLSHTGNVTQTGNIDLTGNLNISGEVTVSSAAQFENIRISGNTVSTTDTNSDLEIGASGSGVVSIPDNDVQVTGNLTVDGTFTVGAITSSGTIQANNFTTGDILIDDNFITTTTSNSDLELRTSGTGSIVVDNFDINNSTINSSTDITLEPGSESVVIDATGSILLPVGTTLERPPVQLGQIRFNNELNRYEGYNGSNWIQLHGVVDLDGDTRVTAELTEGANDDTIRFDIAGSTLVSIDQNQLDAHRVVVDDIAIDGNTIDTITDNTDLVLGAQGTGSVLFDNFAFKDNTITNTVADSVTEFANTNNGYVKFDGTYGLVIPTGTTSERPQEAFSETGMTRFNTTDERVEVWNGTQWISVAGAESGISRSDAENIAFEIVLSLG